MANENVVLRFSDVTFEYEQGKPLLDAVSFSVRGGSRISLMGQNGAGKSTIFGLITGTLRPTDGSVSRSPADVTVAIARQVMPKEALDQTVRAYFATVIKRLAPLGTATTILQLLPHIDPLKKIHSVSREERRALVHLLKALPLTITGLMGYERAVVADGGLVLKEVEGKTMRSRKHANLFVTGDLLHISRPSGGYSLQLCWTTGWVAGSNA